LPLSFPPDCRLYNLYPSPRGIFLALELSCSFGQTVLFLESETAALAQAFPEADSHFLAWTADSNGILYISVDLLKVNLKEFSWIHYVKVNDHNGQTQSPDEAAIRYRPA
jgi:hypothetical protein